VISSESRLGTIDARIRPFEGREGEVVRHASIAVRGGAAEHRSAHQPRGQGRAAAHNTLRPGIQERKRRDTYLFDNGLRECLAHGDAVSKCNSAAGAATSGGGGVVLSGELGRGRAGSRATRDENFSAAVLTELAP
jgi:hypothetical protein